MATSRKRPIVKRVLIIIAALVLLADLYVASFGPACWLCAKGVLPPGPLGIAYWPIVYRGWNYGPGTDAINAYADFWGKPGIIEDLREAAARL
ncbi:MAG: hypothetical protein U0992_04805 [Planctomycetaceae bacterium]